MTTIYITQVQIEDIGPLQKIGKKTFYESFAAENTAADMNAYLEEAFSIEKLTAELNNTNIAFYVATLNQHIIGYLKINMGPSQTELQDAHALEIERIYVLHEFQRKNVGQQLLDKAIQIAIDKNATYIWLGVWEKNAKAIQFYMKTGFEPFDKHIFKLGNDEQTDIMMKRKLTL